MRINNLIPENTEEFGGEQPHQKKFQLAMQEITDVAYIMGNSLRVFYSQPSMSKQLYHIIWLHKRLIEQ